MTKPTSSLTFHSTLIEVPDGSGDCFVCIPDEVMERMGWFAGDTLEVQPHLNRRISISKCSESEMTFDIEVLAGALETFGTPEKANSWLNKHHLILGMSPTEYLNAGGSKEDILKILNAISHGGPV
jgi:hypothetical protein